ncbi:MAG: hypothetical protein KGR98_14870, partial [Verrucomicrobia bacterium]|nr:hypothetical protein [Verrucomicrobiota bacterium]
MTKVTWSGHPSLLELTWMAFARPLIIQDSTLAPAAEWSPPSWGWTLARIAEGSGYCLHQGATCELHAGDGLMAPHTTRVAIRASQLGLLRLQFCQIQPELLNGLLTVAESQRLKILQGHPSPIFFFKADDLNGRRFARLVE